MTLAYIKALLTFDGFKPKFHSLPKNAVNSFVMGGSVYHCEISAKSKKRKVKYQMCMGL